MLESSPESLCATSKGTVRAEGVVTGEPASHAGASTHYVRYLKVDSARRRYAFLASA